MLSENWNKILCTVRLEYVEIDGSWWSSFDLMLYIQDQTKVNASQTANE